MNVRILSSVAVISMLVACSDSTPTTDDGGILDARTDAPARDMALPVDMNTACPTGQHRCGTVCMPDLANTVDVGCSQGCGTACGAAPTHGTTTCSAEGQCDFECEAPWARDGDVCTCTPTVTCGTAGAMCGTPDDGCGTMLNCGGCTGGASCIDGMCGCVPDSAEPNNTNGTARPIDDFNDDDNASADYAFNVSAMADADWFSSNITDGSDGGNPVIEVSLEGIAAGSNYDLAAFFVCGGGDEDQSDCERGTPDNSVGNGCVSSASGALAESVIINTDCSGTFDSDDDGILYIRVTPAAWANTCQNYALHVYVH